MVSSWYLSIDTRRVGGFVVSYICITICLFSA